MPPPKRVGRRKLWNRRELEAAFEGLPEEGDMEPKEWDEDAA
jgi:hypothetical protein